ncbi:hypothetical protein AB0O82_32670 [Kitasatospora sp. NPDC088264]|uniref:hypothetical protein n=1 Tax=Kitasatospora sp. NPDC088264 TaxID=3155296 RepID=UPI003434304B
MAGRRQAVIRCSCGSEKFRSDSVRYTERRLRRFSSRVDVTFHARCSRCTRHITVVIHEGVRSGRWQGVTPA